MNFSNTALNSLKQLIPINLNPYLIYKSHTMIVLRLALTKCEAW